VIDYQKLIDVLRVLPKVSYKGFLFRRVTLAALQSIQPYQFLYSLGSGREGARFTPKNGPSVLYLVADELTAEAELKQGGFENFRKVAAPPSVIFSLRVSLKAILDLTDAKIVKKLGLSPSELTASWRLSHQSSPTQILGLATFSSQKFQAIRYYSIKNPNGVCYAIFTERLDKSSFVEIYDPERNFLERIPAI